MCSVTGFNLDPLCNVHRFNRKNVLCGKRQEYSKRGQVRHGMKINDQKRHSEKHLQDFTQENMQNENSALILRLKMLQETPLKN